MKYVKMSGIKYVIIVLVFAFAGLIFVGDDTKAATYVSNPQVTKLCSSGYRVSVTINNHNFSSIEFPTWTSKGGQDDIVWHKAVISGNTAYYDVSISGHKDEHGLYNTHMYVWDSNHKNLQSMSILINGKDSIIVPVSYEPKKVQTFKNHIYAMFNDYVSSATAITKCEEMGGHLLTINTKEENSFIYNMIKNDDVFKRWHIGGQKNSETKRWQWITKETFNYANWDADEPYEGYSQMAINKNGKMSSIATNSTSAGFILEIDSAIKEAFNTRYKDRTYYLFEEITPREVAYQYCKLKGGTLALITNKEESNKVNQLIQAGARSGYYFGMKRKGSIWYLDNGTRATFFNWISSQPDNYCGHQDCARIYRVDRAWDDEYPYGVNTGFIMEIRDKVKSNTSKKIYSKKIPRGKIKKIKKRSRGRVKIKWKKFKKYSGYILQICRKKKFKKKVIQRYFKRNQTSITVPLKKHRKYYVRVRVYKKKKNNQIFGRWSKVKKIKL